QLKLPSYCEFLGHTMRVLSQVLRPGGVAVLVIGDVTDPAGTTTNLASHVWRTNARTCPLRLEEIITDRLEVTEKVTRIWGRTKGRPTRIDRLLILRNPGSRRYRANDPIRVIEALSFKAAAHRSAT